MHRISTNWDGETNQKIPCNTQQLKCVFICIFIESFLADSVCCYDELGHVWDGKIGFIYVNFLCLTCPLTLENPLGPSVLLYSPSLSGEKTYFGPDPFRVFNCLKPVGCENIHPFAGLCPFCLYWLSCQI